ncbi:MAG: hypothetical protein NUV73_00165 [Candidatus Daviesbacteria bacterium]|nr:hypothetical protein [Candidatus Daviesbacteria bacterium]
MTDEINPFNDVPDTDLPQSDNLRGKDNFINTGALQVGGLGAKAFRSDDQGIWLGAQKFVDAPFKVDMSGGITATSGAIAGWSINSTQIYKNNTVLDSAGQLSLGTGDDIAILSSVDTTYRLWIGDATNNVAAFSVTKAGALYSISGTIGGWTIGATSLMADTGAVGISSAATAGVDWRFWAGHTTPASAPFRVDESGNLVASSANITGAITATSGSIGSFTIGTYLYTGTKTAYNDANAGVHIGSDGIGIGNNVFTVSSAGAIVATSATVTGALTTGAGSSINADYFTAGTINVGGTGHPNAIYVAQADKTSDNNIRWSGGSRIWEDSSNQWGCRSAGDLYMYTGNYVQRVVLTSSGQNSMYGGLYIHDGADGNGNLNITGDAHFNDGDAGGYVACDGEFRNGTNHMHFSGTGRKLELNADITADQSLYIGGGRIQVNGSDKAAIMLLNGEYRTLYCAEAPEVWFFDFAKNKESIDPLFMEATEGELKYIKCDDGTYQVWRRRIGHAYKRFEVKTAEQFRKNNEFWSMPDRL